MMSRAVTLATFALSLPLLVGYALADEKCKGEVEAAFVKQRAQPAFRTVATSPTLNGPLVRTIDFVAPDAIYSKIEAPSEDAPVETIGIGKWAWANTEGGWEEQPPHLAQVVTNEREAYKIPPKAAADFSCLGMVEFEGRKMLGYATEVARDTDGMEVVTTVYIEPETGLPSAYVTKPAKSDGEAKFTAIYSYGSDIVITPPTGVVPTSEPSAGPAP
jgi:hypothetical protein